MPVFKGMTYINRTLAVRHPGQVTWANFDLEKPGPRTIYFVHSHLTYLVCLEISMPDYYVSVEKPTLTAE